jgi:uncharacterized membrane protein YqjE
VTAEAAAPGTFGRVTRVARTLVSVHVEAATREAVRDRDRLLAGAVLAALGAFFVALLLVMLHIAALFALHRYGQPWLVSALAVAGGDLLAGLVCLMLARGRFRAPVLQETRALVRRTVESFTGE